MLLLPEGQTGEAREPFIKQTFFGDWIEKGGKYFFFSLENTFFFSLV
jgi:hypothetical protein